MNEHEYAGLTRKLVNTAIDWKARAEAAEAKLAKAQGVIQFWLDATENDIDRAIIQLCTFLAELKSTTHETGQLSDSYGPIAGGEE